MDNDKIENKSICAKCGGACCKKSGCGYLASDFSSLSFESLKEKLDEGNISIKAVLYFNSETNSLQKVLVLKARSVDKEIVDLFSASSQCKMLTPTGCVYPLALRPSLGAFVKPSLDRNCKISNKQQIDAVKDWLNYQKVLKRLVKFYTGKSMETVYQNQFVEECAVVLAKAKLLRGNIEKLTIAEQEILETINAVQSDMKFELNIANKVSSNIVNKIINKRKL